VSSHPEPENATLLMLAAADGDEDAAERLMPLVYEELRTLAAARLRHERPGQTLQATALVHEAYLRLVGSQPMQWNSRGHFFAAAAEAMRRILIDRARRNLAEKRGGGRDVLPLDGELPSDEAESRNLLSLNEALAAFEKTDPEKAALVKLRHFAGLSEEQAAQALGISRATAARHWAYARAWLYDEILRLQRVVQ
jgi:RNA polymerase sigma factor (TIGR02999 family)